MHALDRGGCAGSRRGSWAEDGAPHCRRAARVLREVVTGGGADDGASEVRATATERHRDGLPHVQDPRENGAFEVRVRFLNHEGPSVRIGGTSLEDVSDHRPVTRVRTMSTSVRYDDATLADIQRRFREGRPSESAKRKRHSRCTLITSLRTEIEQLLNEGYSLDGIAEYFAGLDVHIPAATLKNYLGRARRSLSRTQAVSAQDASGDGRVGSEPRARKTRRSGTDDGAKKKPSRSELGSTDRGGAEGRGREPARDERNMDRAELAESSGTIAHEGQIGGGDLEEPAANGNVDADGDPRGITSEALGDTREARPTNTPTPNAGHGATRGNGEAARDEQPDGHVPAPTPAGMTDAAVSASAQPATRDSTSTSTKGAARPSAHALGLGNIGFVPRR